MKLSLLFISVLGLVEAKTLRGDGRLLDDEPCLKDTDCHPRATCVDDKCVCNEGNAGDGVWVCDDIDECVETNGCGIGEVGREGIYCVDHYAPIKFECGCAAGFTPVLPDWATWTDPDVPREYRPIKCTDNDECASLDESKQCGGNATCVNDPGGYDCVCDDGFEGDGYTCTEVPIVPELHPCEIKSCATNQYCFSGDTTTAKCLCKEGWFSPSGAGGACSDVDECLAETHNCDPNAACTNTIGGFNCQCTSGWKGNGKTCDDIDECELNWHDCDPAENLVCVNRPGTYICGIDTEAPSTTPTTGAPSSSPSVSDACSLNGGALCGMGMNAFFTCSCSNTCAAEGTCCHDFEDSCGGYNYTTTTVDVVLTPGASGSDSASATLRCGNTFLGRGVSSGCGFNLNFNTLGSNSVTCDCITVQLVGDVDDAEVSVYHQGVNMPLVSMNDPNATSLSAGDYSLDCSYLAVNDVVVNDVAVNDVAVNETAVNETAINTTLP